MKKTFMLIVLFFMLNVTNVFGYQQAEVSGDLDYKNEYGELTFERYVLDRNFNNEPIILICYKYTNTSGRSREANDILEYVHCRQDGMSIFTGYPGFDDSAENAWLYKNNSLYIRDGESIECCAVFKIKNSYTPIEISYSESYASYNGMPINGTIDLSMVNKPESYDLDLSDGHYVGGLGIPTGIYTLTLVSGHGNVYSKGSINEIFGQDKTTIYNNFNFSDGVELNISGALTIHIHSDAADFGSVRQRQIVNEQEAILPPGTYTAGFDFYSGTYFICAYEGSGNVYSHDADVNEIISVEPKEGHSVFQYNYATFEPDDTIEISRCTIKLIPAGS